MFENKPELTIEEAKKALDVAAQQVERNLPDFTDSCQNHSSVNNFYPKCENDQWTCGFWPGEVWLSYEHTGKEVYKEAALSMIDSFDNRIRNKIVVDHHDMGFLYTPSCVAAYKLTGNEKAKQAAILAADQLVSRFQPVGGFLQAWGSMNDAGNYRYIIDCLLNLPLLYWAEEVTGDRKYGEIAHKHITTCLKHSIREDGSTYHTFFMNMETGEPDHGETCQGYKNDSCWARGQAWGVYGTAISYAYTKRPEYLDAFRKTATYYLDKLPEDMIPYWDMIFGDGDDEPRDSSSASIVACGFLEAAKYLPEEEAEEYRKLAAKMLKSLVDNYAVKDFTKSNGLVLHGTYSKKSPYNTCTPGGVDECVSWGDYFYMEALTRFSKDWEMYW